MPLKAVEFSVFCGLLRLLQQAVAWCFISSYGGWKAEGKRQLLCSWQGLSLSCHLCAMHLRNRDEMCTWWEERALGEQALFSSEDSNPNKRGTPDDYICTFRYCHLVGWDFELQHMNQGEHQLCP